MDKISLIIVVYNTTDVLRNLLRSLSVSENTLDITVMNNSDYPLKVDDFNCKVSFNIINTGQNLGYFGAINFLKSKNPSVFMNKWLIISNADVDYSDFDFEKLSKMRFNEPVWLLPGIYYKRKNLNPKYLYRLKKSKILTLEKITRIPFLANLYELLGNAKQMISNGILGKSLNNSDLELVKVYAGHGSCFILNYEFSNSVDFKIDNFLFGEEIYVAEKVIDLKGRVLCDFDLRVFDMQHVGTKIWRNSKVIAWQNESLNNILKKYYV